MTFMGYILSLLFYLLYPKKNKRLGCTCGTDKSVAKFSGFLFYRVGLSQFICHGYVVSCGHFLSEVKHKYNYGIFLRPTFCLSLMYLSQSIICQGITVFIIRCTQKLLNITIFLITNNIYQDCFKSNL